ncbi:MAG: hypothetical protein ACRC5T_09965 [Cetobacterium sp.]
MIALIVFICAVMGLLRDSETPYFKSVPIAAALTLGGWVLASLSYLLFAEAFALADNFWVSLIFSAAFYFGTYGLIKKIIK